MEMKNKTVLIIFLVLINSFFASVNAQFNVKKYGAKGNGITLDTRFIQKAIDKAYENGGGVVDVPTGTYLTGTLILKDNVELHIQPGAIILGSPDYKDYEEIIHRLDSRTNGLYAKHFMIFAEGARNISITGTGVIHGNGLKSFQKSRPQNLRPYMIRLVNCENITIRDVKLLESANWTLHLLGCRDVNIDGIAIENGTDSNRDGLDIDACNRVTVSNSRFLTGDDAIVMKATNDTLCQNITITNCIIRTNASAIKTGTESNGGFRNITVSNCILRDIPEHAGIELMTVDGGIMQNILIENITMENVATPVFIRLGNRARPFKQGQYVSHVDDVKDIYLNNITVLDSKLPSGIIGMHAKKIQNVVINNYSVRSSVGQKPVAYNKVPFEEFSYPAASVFKNLPAYGFYCRNVNELQMKNITMFSAENETRPALVFDRVNNLELSSVKAEVRPIITPMVYLRNSKNIVAHFCRSLTPGDMLFAEEENSVENIHFSDNILQTDQKEIVKVPPLQDESFFEDFETELKYNAESAEKFKGMDSWDLKNNPLKFEMNITKRGSLQLCLLMLNNSKQPEKVLVKYEGITQEFEISWNEWGWAPITLLKEYPADQKVDFEIYGNENSDLKISKIYVRYQDVRKTD
jgi:hypothetical protein